MSAIKVLNMAGAEVGTVELNDSIFGIEPNTAVVHEVVKNHLANCRQGTQSALTRAVQTSMANLINVYDILKAKYLVLDKEALTVIEEVFA